jgi:hypothetical protein
LQRADPADLSGLAAAACWHTVDPATLDALHHSGTLRFTIADPGICTGFAGWFAAELAHGIVLRNGPDDPATHWGCAYLPLDAPLAVQPGDVLTLALKAVTVMQRVIWSWRWDWAGPGRWRTGQGGSDDLWTSLAEQVTAPGAAVGGLELTPDGQMVATVLAAFRPGLSEADIVTSLHEADGVFTDVATTRRWVRKIVSRYGRPMSP